MSELAAETFDLLASEFPGAVELRTNPGPAAQHSILINPEALVEIAGFLRDNLAFDLLTDLSGVDWPDPALADKVAVPHESSGRAGGFLEVVYHIESTTRRGGVVTLRCRTGDRADAVALPSLVSVWRSAEFQEREVFDLYGVRFTNHPDLRRILMWDEFTDHPMRKDYNPPDDYEYEPTPHGEIMNKAGKQNRNRALE